MTQTTLLPICSLTKNNIQVHPTKSGKRALHRYSILEDNPWNADIFQDIVLEEVTQLLLIQFTTAKRKSKYTELDKKEP